MPQRDLLWVLPLEELGLDQPDARVLEDGRLTDGHGRTVDFSNTIIVMTSNIGSQQILELTESGALDVEIEAHVQDLLKKTLRPELLNRIDDTVVFHQLTKEQLLDIAGIQVEVLRRRMADRGLTLELTDDALAALVSEGWDPHFGARPLRRTIRQRIENEIASLILAGTLEEGDRVLVDAAGETFRFETMPATAPEPAESP